MCRSPSLDGCKECDDLVIRHKRGASNDCSIRSGSGMLTYSGMQIEAGRLRLRVNLCSGNVQLLCAGGGKGRPPPCAFWTICVGRLRGGRHGATAPPAPPARGAAPGNPDSMQSHSECQTHMLTGRLRLAAYMHVLAYQRHMPMR